MTKVEQEYHQAWERVQAGKTNIVGKNMPKNQVDTVALEAGKKKGSLRTSKYPELCREIIAYEVGETEVQHCTRLKEQYKADKYENEILWKGALARELMMKKRLIALEMEIKRIKKIYPGIVFNLDDLDKDYSK